MFYTPLDIKSAWYTANIISGYNYSGVFSKLNTDVSKNKLMSEDCPCSLVEAGVLLFLKI
jgi:hypothetical protein